MNQHTTTDDSSIVRVVLAVVLILIAIPFVMMVVMMPMMGTWGVGHMNGWMWDGSGASGVWILMWVVMLGILLGGGYLIYRALLTPRQSSDAALEALRTAYARGDISDEQFEKRRQRLRQD